MAVSKTAQARRKTTKRPQSYYKNLRRALTAEGRTAPKHAEKHQEEQKITPQEVMLASKDLHKVWSQADISIGEHSPDRIVEQLFEGL